MDMLQVRGCEPPGTAPKAAPPQRCAGPGPPAAGARRVRHMQRTAHPGPLDRARATQLAPTSPQTLPTRARKRSSSSMRKLCAFRSWGRATRSGSRKRARSSLSIWSPCSGAPPPQPARSVGQRVLTTRSSASACRRRPPLPRRRAAASGAGAADRGRAPPASALLQRARVQQPEQVAINSWRH